MKKYLITGVLALVVGGFLASCHDNEGVYGSLVEQKLQTYEQIFKQEFGEINPNQDWGFGESSTAASTRGENANRNEWADPDKAYGGWEVPPTLTEGQKKRVYKYFQTHPDITYVDPHLTNFFVQQVYKGKDDPKTGDYEEGRPYSAEEYQSANSEMVIGSNHMDLLTCGYGTEMGTGYEGASAVHYYDHIGDFNYGTYNGGGTVTVLNNGQHVGGASHEDQISLMVNSRTDCIGYWNSDGSCGHNDRCALVSAKLIDDWAKDPNNYENGKIIGEDVWYGKDKDGIENSHWNRSFVGLDFDQVIGNDIYAKGVSRPDENGNWVYYPDEYATFEFEGNTYHFLNSNTNFYCADRSEPKYGGVYNPGNEPDADTKRELLQLGYRPYDTALHDWCKVGGCADGFYTDWIVTLTPANNLKTPDTQIIDIITPTDGPTTNTTITYWNKIEYKNSGRVFCEDLGVVSGSDIDFNDIVFDAYIYEMTPIKRTVTVVNGVETVEEVQDGTPSNFAEVYLLAAGGTLEVSVGEINVKNSFGVGKTTMVNTIDEKVKEDGSVSTYGNDYVIGGKEVVYLGRLPYSRIIDIPVYVTYNSLDQKDVLVLQAYQGAAPHKICVPIGTRWPFERIEINKAYKGFTDYVKSPGRLGQVNGPVNTEYGGYSSDESGEDCWTDNSNIEEANLYRNLPYDAPQTGVFYEESDKQGSTGSVTGKQGGYDGQPVLVRRRH